MLGEPSLGLLAGNADALPCRRPDVLYLSGDIGRQGLGCDGEGAARLPVVAETHGRGVYGEMREVVRGKLGADLAVKRCGVLAAYLEVDLCAGVRRDALPHLAGKLADVLVGHAQR